MLSSKADIYKCKFNKNKLTEIERLPFSIIFISSIKILNHYIKPKNMNGKIGQLVII